jgi:hypothetical protein
MASFPSSSNAFSKKKVEQPISQPQSIAPAQPTNEQIKVNNPTGISADKTYEIKINDPKTGLPQTFNLNEQQFNQRQSNTGVIDPKLAQLIELEKSTTLKNKIQEQLKQGADITSITNQLLREDLNRRGFNQQQPTQESPLTPQMQENVVAPNIAGNDVFMNSLQQGFDNPIKAFKEQGKGFVGEAVLKPIAQVYDFVQSLFNSGKSINQLEAEKTLTAIRTDMQQDIALVKLGLKTPQDVQVKIQLAEQAISRLESSVKGLGQLNVRYWLLDGKDVEAKLIIERGNIEDFKAQLLMAQVGQQQQNALNTFGQ